MRTVTFSNADVAERVNADFVAVWANRAPGFHNEDDRQERRIFEKSPDSYATRNICTFFLTPGGTVFHYVAGYSSPALFLEHLKLVLEARRTAFEQDFALKKNGLESIHALHAERAKSESWTCEGELAYGDLTHRHTDACRKNHSYEVKYRRELHRYWSTVPELPALEKVRFDYLYGSSFTEECDGATPIAGRSLTNG
jgi:hypothetical protein